MSLARDMLARDIEHTDARARAAIARLQADIASLERDLGQSRHSTCQLTRAAAIVEVETQRLATLREVAAMLDAEART